MEYQPREFLFAAGTIERAVDDFKLTSRLARPEEFSTNNPEHFGRKLTYKPGKGDEDNYLFNEFRLGDWPDDYYDPIENKQFECHIAGRLRESYADVARAHEAAIDSTLVELLYISASILKMYQRLNNAEKDIIHSIRQVERELDQ